MRHNAQWGSPGSAAIALLLIAGCSDGAKSPRGDPRAGGEAIVRAHGGKSGIQNDAAAPHHYGKAGAGGAEAQGGTEARGGAEAQGGAGAPGAAEDAAIACAGPTPIGPLVVLTAQTVQACEFHTPGCPGQEGRAPAPSELAFDYGDFPFITNGRPRTGEYFFAVVAAGSESAGFFQDAPGNLSDDAPSAVQGDLGSGDTLGDRTITVIADSVPFFAPAGHGTHKFSFPPSQFMVIDLTPFDTTAQGNYVFALCPTNATRRCECAFEAFTAATPAADAGSGSGGSGAAGTPGGSGGSHVADASVGGAGGASGGSADASGPDSGPCTSK
jgi:hypothetical protein